MSHEIHIRKNGFAEMAYVGEKPWHNLGQEVTKGASIDHWQKQAGLDWVAKEAKAQYLDESGRMLTASEHKVIYRSDTSEPLGMVGGAYKVVQPRDVLEFFKDLAESGGWHINTAGSLRGGRKIWAMATCEVEGFVAGFDGCRPNLLLATSLDGSMKTIAKLVIERVVCANTMGMALGEAGTQFEVSHRHWFNPDEIKESLGVSVACFDEFMRKANELTEMPINLSDARDLLRSLFGMPKARDINDQAEDVAFQRLMAQVSKTGDQKLIEQRSVDRVLRLFQGEGIASALPGVAGTRWGLLNAVTQHIDHERGRTDDTRMESAWFGKGEVVKGAAYELLTEGV